MSSAERSAERSAPTAVGEYEAEDGKHNQKRRDALALLSGGETRAACDPDAEPGAPTSAAAAHITWKKK